MSVDYFSYNDRNNDHDNDRNNDYDNVIKVIVMVIVTVILMVILTAIVNRQSYRLTLVTIMCLIIDKVMGLVRVMVVVIVI